MSVDTPVLVLPKVLEIPGRSIGKRSGVMRSRLAARESGRLGQSGL